jgi:hypothetical protein
MCVPIRLVGSFVLENRVQEFGRLELKALGDGQHGDVPSAAER